MPRSRSLIEKLQAGGIRRAGSPRNGFRYRTANGALVSAAERERIKGLRIPPAWQQVAIAVSSDAPVQAIGLDAAGRWQYLYLRAHSARRARSKFIRLSAFGRALPALRKCLRRDLALEGLPRERVTAAAILMLSATALRPGNDEYARKNGTFGLATLRPRHVTLRGNLLKLSFRGKHGIQQECELHSRRLAHIVRLMLRWPGRELFKFLDEAGGVVDLRSQHLNDYVKQAMGARFTASGFRTWIATLVCAAALKGEGVVPVRERRSAVVRAMRATGLVLGNTPSVARGSYVHPALITAYLEGRVVSEGLADPYTLADRIPRGLHRAERALLRLLERERG